MPREAALQRSLIALGVVGVLAVLAWGEGLPPSVRVVLALVGALLAAGQVIMLRMAYTRQVEQPVVERLLKENEDLERDLAATIKERDEVEHYFDTLMESVPSNVYFKDRESHFLKVNQSMAEWFGLGHPADVVGKTDNDFFGPEHANQARADEEKIMSTGRSMTGYVERETFETGDETYVLTNKMPFRDRNGYVIGTWGISSDVTELVTTQKTLENERNTLRLLIDGFPDNIYIRDRAGKYLVVNQALADFVGCKSPEEVVGRTPMDFFVRERAEKFLAEDLKVMETGEPVRRRESRLKNARGEERMLMISKVPVRDSEGNVIGIVGWNRDVTEQRLAAEELQRSEERVQEIVDHCPAVIYLKDLDGRYLMVNREFRTIFKMATDDVLGRTDLELFEEDIAKKFRENDRIAEERRKPIQVEEIAPHEDGPHTYVSVKFPLLGADDEVYAVGGISTDITERKQAEEAMEQLNEDLVKANRDLRAAQEQLIQAEKMESVGRLAAGVAHEVKNPLAMIGMGLEVLARKIPEDDEQGQGTVDRMKRGIDRAKEIVKGLVDFSSASQLGLQEYELSDVVNESLMLVDYELRQAKVEVKRELADELPTVMLDKTKIEQVLVNLYINAAHAMDGGGTLTVRTSAETLGPMEHDEGARVKERWREGDVILKVIVEDTGEGIDDEKIGKIFDPFFTTKPTGHGTGLGLAVSRKIADLHGGMITLENREEGGARAILSLPAKD